MSVNRGFVGPVARHHEIETARRAGMAPATRISKSGAVVEAWSAPLPQWVLDAMAEALAGRRGEEKLKVTTILRR